MQAEHRRRPYWYWLITLALAAVLLGVAIHNVDWRQTIAVLTAARLERLALAALVLGISYFWRSLRWRILLGAQKRLAAVPVYQATLVGYLGNNFLPARSGEFIRAALLGRRAGLSGSFILGTIFTERIVDVVALLALGGGAWFVSPALNRLLPVGWGSALRTSGIAAAMMLAILLLMPRTRPICRRLVNLLPLTPHWRNRLLAGVENFWQGLETVNRPDRLWRLAGLTVVIWLLDSVAAITVAWALSLGLNLVEALFFLTALALSSALPSTPGYVGVYQFVAVTVLPLFGFSPGEALAYIVAFQAVAYFVVIIGGGWGLWHLSAAAPPAESPS